MSYTIKMQPDKLIRSNRKTIALQVDDQAQLVVRAPFHVSMRKINSFIEEKSEWIRKAQEKVSIRIKLVKENTEFKDGKRIMYLGREFEICINGKMQSIEINENHMEFPFRFIEKAEDTLIKWYKKKAKEIIIPRCIEYSEILNLDVNKICITSAQKRWGSCNSKGNINFSYRLVMTPPEIIDYVIVHELMHLKELNHSSKFWEHVESAIPDYKSRKKWLRDNQSSLQM